jgi:hypothetical protein
MEEIHISKKRLKTGLLVLGAGAFVAAGIFVWIIANPNSMVEFIFFRAVAVSCVLFFGLLGLIGLVRVFDFRPGVVLKAEGLVDHTTLMGGRLVAWKDIVRIEVLDVGRSKFILLHIRNPEEYMGMANGFQRFLMRLNMKWYGTPVSISTVLLDCDMDELVGKLEERRGV